MDAAMSHVYSFFLFAFSLYLYAKWLQKQSVWLSVFLGLTTGLIVLIRPTNFTFVLMLMIHFLIKDRDHIKTFKFVIENWLKIFLIVVSAFLIVLPQLYYWKLNTGHWVFYSYQGENFFFNHPQIINGLFSYNKGWLIYTPVMWLAILGFFFMRKELSKWLIPSVITMLLSIYIIFSWWCWWYGGGFGARALVEFYVVMSLPLGAFFAWVLNKNIIYKFLTAFVLSFLLLLNLFQTKQYSTSLLHYDSMSKEVYWAIWNKDGWPQGYEKMLKPNDTEKAKKGESSFPF
jgi:hypothetical protein